MSERAYARRGSSQNRIHRLRQAAGVPDDDTFDLHQQPKMRRGGIPASIKTEHDAFEAGATDSYLGLSREEWDKAGSDLRRMAGLD